MADHAAAQAPPPRTPPTYVGGALDRLVSFLALCGVATLIVAIALTWADIIWRRVVGGAFIDVVDIIKLCLVAAASFAIPYGFVRGSHVTVDLLAERLPRRARLLLEGAVHLACAALLGLILYLSWFAALQRYSFGDTTLNLRIPMIYYWALFLAGLALAVAVATERAVRSALAALSGRDGRTP
jgi:TRAP-type C4-dicarboxylate transport system permease small subunit